MLRVASTSEVSLALSPSQPLPTLPSPVVCRRRRISDPPWRGIHSTRPQSISRRLASQSSPIATIQASRFADTAILQTSKYFILDHPNPLFSINCPPQPPNLCPVASFDSTSLLFFDISFEVSRSLQEPTKSAHLFVFPFVRSTLPRPTAFNPANNDKSRARAPGSLEPKPEPACLGLSLSRSAPPAS